MPRKSRPKRSRSRYGAGMSAIDKANEATFQREQEIRELLDRVVDTYAPGGSFGAGTEAMLSREKDRYTSSATQQLISSGLYGSTVAAGIPKKFEEEIGMPTRLRLEDMRTQAYTGALGQKASFIERIEDISPSFETIANLTQAASSKPKSSLSDWLSANFASVPNAATTSQAPQRQAIAEDDKRRAQTLATLRAKYGTVGVAS